MDTTLLPNYPNPIKEQRIQKIPHPNNQMAEFMSDLYGGLRPSPSSFSYLEMDPTMDILRYSNTTSAFHQVPNETNLFLFPQEVVVPLQSQDMSGVVVPEGGGGGGGIFQKNNNNSNHDDMKRKRKKKNNKPLEFSQGSCSASASASASANSSVPVNRRKQGSGGGKGKKIIKGDEEGDRGRKEVVHVRARRGQATDSHSLAERVRRGKINERLRFLQDIVPGCYKTMGLAVMLDEIINYVQSLQRQVEFLSMKLTTASSFYDFNSESDLFDTVRRAKAYEAKEIEKIIMRGKLEGHSVTSTTTNNSSNPISTFPPPF